MAIPAAAHPRTRAQSRIVEHDLGLVRGAIDLISAGGADRVTLVNLTAAERILAQAHAMGFERGVVVRALWRDDRQGCDIAVEAPR